ncbi:MAG: hypothetical protein IKP10_05460 [Clostridia bacterium]|nr:hypothetical protein [Clostridia bacterium]
MKKGWIVAFALVMTAVCLFLCWSAVDRSLQLGRIAEAQDNLDRKRDKIPRQLVEWERAKQEFAPVYASEEALTAELDSLLAQRAELQTVVDAYKAGRKSSDAKNAAKARYEAAVQRRDAARAALDSLLETLGSAEGGDAQ